MALVYPNGVADLASGEYFNVSWNLLGQRFLTPDNLLADNGDPSTVEVGLPDPRTAEHVYAGTSPQRVTKQNIWGLPLARWTFLWDSIVEESDLPTTESRNQGYVVPPPAKPRLFARPASVGGYPAATYRVGHSWFVGDLTTAISPPRFLTLSAGQAYDYTIPPPPPGITGVGIWQEQPGTGTRPMWLQRVVPAYSGYALYAMTGPFRYEMGEPAFNLTPLPAPRVPRRFRDRAPYDLLPSVLEGVEATYEFWATTVIANGGESLPSPSTEPLRVAAAEKRRAIYVEPAQDVGAAVGWRCYAMQKDGKTYVVHPAGTSPEQPLPFDRAAEVYSFDPSSWGHSDWQATYRELPTEDTTGVASPDDPSDVPARVYSPTGLHPSGTVTYHVKRSRETNGVEGPASATASLAVSGGQSLQVGLEKEINVLRNAEFVETDRHNGALDWFEYLNDGYVIPSGGSMTLGTTGSVAKGPDIASFSLDIQPGLPLHVGGIVDVLTHSVGSIRAQLELYDSAGNHITAAIRPLETVSSPGAVEVDEVVPVSYFAGFPAATHLRLAFVTISSGGSVNLVARVHDLHLIWHEARPRKRRKRTDEQARKKRRGPGFGFGLKAFGFGRRRRGRRRRRAERRERDDANVGLFHPFPEDGEYGCELPKRRRDLVPVAGRGLGGHYLKTPAARRSVDRPGGSESPDLTEGFDAGIPADYEQVKDADTATSITVEAAPTGFGTGNVVRFVDTGTTASGHAYLRTPAHTFPNPKFGAWAWSFRVNALPPAGTWEDVAAVTTASNVRIAVLRLHGNGVLQFVSRDRPSNVARTVFRSVVVGNHFNFEVQFANAGSDQCVVDLWGERNNGGWLHLSRLEDTSHRTDDAAPNDALFPAKLEVGLVTPSSAAATGDVSFDYVRSYPRGSYFYYDHNPQGVPTLQGHLYYKRGSQVRQDRGWFVEEAVKPGQSYAFGVRYRQAGVPNAAKMWTVIFDLLDGTSREVGCLIGDSGLTGTHWWNDYQRTFTAPQGAYRVRLVGRDVGAGEFAYQDLCMTEGTTVKRTGLRATTGYFRNVVYTGTPRLPGGTNSLSRKWKRIVTEVEVLEGPIPVSYSERYRSAPSKFGPFPDTYQTDVSSVPQDNYLEIRGDFVGSGQSTAIIAPESPYLEQHLKVGTLLRGDGTEFGGGVIVTDFQVPARRPRTEIRELLSGRTHRQNLPGDPPLRVDGFKLQFFTDEAVGEFTETALTEEFVIEARGKSCRVKFFEQPVVKVDGRSAARAEDEFGEYYSLVATCEIPRAEVLSVSDF